jgi:nuclease S1
MKSGASHAKYWMEVWLVIRWPAKIWKKVRRLAPLAALLLTILPVPDPVWAWGRVGHRAAARMAESRLTPSALAAVHALLGPGVSVADASTWADEQREIPEAHRWHYVNIPIREMQYAPRFCQSGGCVVSKIEDFRRILRDPRAGRLQKQQALKFLIHFIADLHQPLHVGDNKDQGGNLLQVRFYGIGTNLHRVWDSEIIERHTKNERVWLWDFDFIANPRMVVEWSKGTPEDWANETLQVAKVAYCLPGTGTPMKSGFRLGNEYCTFALPVIQKQLAKSGIRIAFVLNEIFR